MGHHHGHGHGHHHHDHSHAPANMTKAFAIGVGANLVFTVIEAIYAVSANSTSLLADAGHNLGDVLGIALAWFAAWLLTLNANRKYSYGYKRTTILAAISNAVLLIVASLFIVYEAIMKLIHLSSVHEMTVIIVAALGIIVNGVTALLFMKGSKDDLNIKGAFLHLAADALTSLGVVVAGIVILKTGWSWLDPVVAIVIVALILWGTWGLLRDSLDLIMDAVPQWVSLQKVEAYLNDLDGVVAVHDLHVWGLSTRAAALTAHLVMPEKWLSSAQYQQIRNELKHKFRIEHVTLQIEKEQGEACVQDCC